eukprot:gene3775-2666_t
MTEACTPPESEAGGPKVGKSLHIRDGSEADERGAQRGEGEGEVHPADPSAKEEGQKTKQKNSSPATQQAQEGCWRLPSSSSLARSLSSLSVLSSSVAHSGRCSRETSRPMAQDVCVCGIGTHYWKRGEDFGSWLVSLSHPLVSGGCPVLPLRPAPRQGKQKGVQEKEEGKEGRERGGDMRQK